MEPRDEIEYALALCASANMAMCSFVLTNRTKNAYLISAYETVLTRMDAEVRRQRHRALRLNDNETGQWANDWNTFLKDKQTISALAKFEVSHPPPMSLSPLYRKKYTKHMENVLKCSSNGDEEAWDKFRIFIQDITACPQDAAWMVAQKELVDLFDGVIHSMEPLLHQLARYVRIDGLTRVTHV